MRIIIRITAVVGIEAQEVRLRVRIIRIVRIVIYRRINLIRRIRGSIDSGPACRQCPIRRRVIRCYAQVIKVHAIREGGDDVASRNEVIGCGPSLCIASRLYLYGIGGSRSQSVDGIWACYAVHRRPVLAVRAITEVETCLTIGIPADSSGRNRDVICSYAVRQLASANGSERRAGTPSAGSVFAAAVGTYVEIIRRFSRQVSEHERIGIRRNERSLTGVKVSVLREGYLPSVLLLVTIGPSNHFGCSRQALRSNVLDLHTSRRLSRYKVYGRLRQEVLLIGVVAIAAGVAVVSSSGSGNAIPVDRIIGTFIRLFEAYEEVAVFVVEGFGKGNNHLAIRYRKRSSRHHLLHVRPVGKRREGSSRCLRHIDLPLIRTPRHGSRRNIEGQLFDRTPLYRFERVCRYDKLAECIVIIRIISVYWNVTIGSSTVIDGKRDSVGRRKGDSLTPATFVSFSANNFHAGIIGSLRGETGESSRCVTADGLAVCVGEVGVQAVFQHPCRCRSGVPVESSDGSVSLRKNSRESVRFETARQFLHHDVIHKDITRTSRCRRHLQGYILPFSCVVIETYLERCISSSSRVDRIDSDERSRILRVGHYADIEGSIVGIVLAGIELDTQGADILHLRQDSILVLRIIGRCVAGIIIRIEAQVIRLRVRIGRTGINRRINLHRRIRGSIDSRPARGQCPS